MYVAVLEVGKGREVAADVVVGAGIDVGVEFLALVAVVFLLRVDGADIVAHPRHLAIVAPYEIVCRSAKGDIPAVVTVVEVYRATAEVVVVIFQTYEV